MKKLQAVLAADNLDSTRIDVALRTVAAYRGAQGAKIQIDILTSARDRTQLQVDRMKALETQ